MTQQVKPLIRLLNYWAWIILAAQCCQKWLQKALQGALFSHAR